MPVSNRNADRGALINALSKQCTAPVMHALADVIVFYRSFLIGGLLRGHVLTLEQGNVFWVINSTTLVQGLRARNNVRYHQYVGIPLIIRMEVVHHPDGAEFRCFVTLVLRNLLLPLLIDCDPVC